VTHKYLQMIKDCTPNNYYWWFSKGLW